jgi:patatin-like phospholipase/acyl hydrolase
VKPLRKNVAIAIDGGGIRGVIVTKALSLLEERLGKPVHDIFRLAAGTSTGSIISAGIGSGLTAIQLHQLYVSLGDTIFKKSWRTFFWPLTRFRFPHEPLAKTLQEHIGNKKMGDFWTANPPTDVVITTFDMPPTRPASLNPGRGNTSTGRSSGPYSHPVPSQHIFRLSRAVTWTAGLAHTPIPATWRLTKPNFV